MSKLPPEQLLERHEAFLNYRAADRPLLGYWVGGYYPAEQFPRGTSAWQNATALQPGRCLFRVICRRL